MSEDSTTSLGCGIIGTGYANTIVSSHKVDPGYSSKQTERQQQRIVMESNSIPCVMARILTNPPPNFHIVKTYLEDIDSKMDMILNDKSINNLKTGIWDIYRLHHQRSMYIFKMYENKQIDTALYKYLCESKYVDIHLVGLWKKKGYENLCCSRCIDSCSKNNNVCICRVPERYSDQQHEIECDNCGCKGCSGY